MAIQITRSDALAAVGTESHAPGVLSVERFDDMAAAIASLRERGIPVTDVHAAEFANHADTQFAWTEVVNAGHSVYQARVQYDVRSIG